MSDNNKHTRVTDLIPLAREENHFTLRRLHPGTSRLIILFAASFLAILGIVFNIDLLSPQLTVTIISCIFLMLIAGISLFMDHVYRSILANQFENSLFSGAINTEAEFSIIVKKNQDIVYFSPKFFSFFNLSSSPTITDFDDLLNQFTLTDSAKENLIYGLKTGKSIRAFCQLKEANNSQKLYLLLRPIERPRGYAVLKAVNESFFGNGEASENDVLLAYTLLENISWPAYIANEHNDIIYINDIFTDKFGYAKNDLKKTPLQLDMLFGNKAASFAKDSTTHTTISIINKAGNAEEIELNHAPVLGGNIRKYVGLISHISQKAEIPLEMGDNNLQQVWDYMMTQFPIAIACLDSKGNIAKGNKAFTDLVGKQKIGVSVESLAHDSSKNKIRELLKPHPQSGKLPPVEIQLDGKTPQYLSIYINELESPDDIGYHYIAFLTDITEQKNLEQHFTQAHKMQAVGQLAGGVAHDFNNLLTAMIGFCDLLLTRHPPGDQSFADIMEIKQNASRAANLVRQLLAFSRKQTLQPKVTDITDALADLSNLIRRLIGENISLKMQHGKDLGMVKVDKNQLEQVVINLAVNARDAMQDGGKLTISTGNVTIDDKHHFDANFVPPSHDDIATNGTYVRIDIKDSGSGISPELMEQIFEPFFTTKEMGAGTGLGLSTVYGIVKQTGGYLYVYSKEGEGTTFSILFKHHRMEDLPAKSNAENAKSPQDLTGAGTILLVEDEGPVRTFSARALTNKGYKVIEAESGEKALELVAEHGDNIDLIISDVMMPGITGPEMIEKIIENRPDVRVIFISGYGEDAFVDTYGSSRKFNFLPKPFTLKQLASRVKEVMEIE